MHTVRIGTIPETSPRGLPIRADVFAKIEYKESGDEQKEKVRGGYRPHKREGSGRLSISGVVGPLSNGNARGSCGQIDGDIREAFEAGTLETAPGWTPETVARFLEVWDRWHLNDMRPTCEHQRALGWDRESRESVTLYQWTLKPEIYQKKKELEAEAIERAKSTDGKTAGFYAQDRKILGLEAFIKTDSETLAGDLARYYEPTKESGGYFAHKETKARGWLSPEEHPQGLLGKPCPVCGYKYGSAWQVEPVPADVLAFLNALPETDKKPAWV